MDYYDYRKRVFRFDKPTCEIFGMMEELNYYYGECYELGWRGKHHCRVLTNFGQLVAFGTKNIWEHLRLALVFKGGLCHDDKGDNLGIASARP